MIKPLLFISVIFINFLFADYFRDATIAYKSGDYKKARDFFELSIKKDKFSPDKNSIEHNFLF